MSCDAQSCRFTWLSSCSSTTRFRAVDQVAPASGTSTTGRAQPHVIGTDMWLLLRIRTGRLSPIRRPSSAASRTHSPSRGRAARRPMRCVAAMPTPILKSRTTTPVIQSSTTSCCHDQASPERDGAGWSAPGLDGAGATTGSRATSDTVGATVSSITPADRRPATAAPVAGAASGVLLAAWGTTALPSLAPTGLPRIDQIGLDGRTLLFTLAVTLVMGVVFGLVPALQALRGMSRKGSGVSPT